MASLKETISGLKAAGDVEGRLKAQTIALHGQITAAQHAQVAAPLLRSRADFQPLRACMGSLVVRSGELAL